MLSALRDKARWLVIGGLILVNAALITALIVRQSHSTTSAVPGTALRPETAVTTALTPSSTPTPTTAPTATPTPTTPEQTGQASPETRPRTARLLTANSNTIAWRAERGDCGQRASIEVTTNGGKTWRRVDSGLRGIVRLQAYGDRSVFAIGADAACRPTYASVQSPNQQWHRDPSVVWDTWFTYPNNPDRVHAPGGRSYRPCGETIRSFSATGTTGAAVICADGRVRTSRTGQIWRTLQHHSTAVALGSSDRALLIASPAPSCAGVIVQPLAAAQGATAPTSASCTGQLGPVAVAGNGSTNWRWVRSRVSVR